MHNSMREINIRSLSNENNKYKSNLKCLRSLRFFILIEDDHPGREFLYDLRNVIYKFISEILLIIVFKRFNVLTIDINLLII